MCVFFASKTVDGEYIDHVHPSAVLGDDASMRLVDGDETHDLLSKQSVRFGIAINGYLFVRCSLEPGEVSKTKRDLLLAVTAPLTEDEADARLTAEFGPHWWDRLAIRAVHVPTRDERRAKKIDWFAECYIDEPELAYVEPVSTA